MIGIRKEDKSEWEGRAPLVPHDIQRLREEHGIAFAVARSKFRKLPDADYAAAGAELRDSVDDCPIIMGVKEIPPEKFVADRTYIYFSHTIKGQSANMPALKRLIELGCTLIDYEKIEDEQGRRLVFFGRYAGLAGMIDSVWALGQRLRTECIDNPFEKIEPAHRYRDLAHVEQAFAALADEIRAHGVPEGLRPFICGFSGYGQVSMGAQYIYDLLPTREIAPHEIASAAPAADVCYKVVFKEEHLVERIDGAAPFELQEYYRHPERYQSTFFPHAAHLTMLMNCIYWEPKYPRLIDREQFKTLYADGQPRLRVVGDISCDIDGAVACTTHCTTPANPVYVYEPQSGETRAGVEGHGPVVLAVDFLPCELPVDASRHFSRSLTPLMPALAQADLRKPLEQTGLPEVWQRATIVHRGELTEPYRYLREFLE